MKKTLFILAIVLCGVGMLSAQRPMRGFVSGGLSNANVDASFATVVAGETTDNGYTVSAELPFSHLIQTKSEATVMNGEDYVDEYFVFTPAKFQNAGEHHAYFLVKDPKKLDVSATLDLTVIKCGGKDDYAVYAKGANYNYPSVYVSNHCWTKENMKETPNDFANQAFPYDNDPANEETYGLLYTWNAAMASPETSGSTNDNTNNNETTTTPDEGAPSYTQGVCPEGWHIPTPGEMADLRTNSAFDLNATILWQGTMASQNTNATGFTALPAGMFNDVLNRFESLGTQTDWWSDNGGHASETTVTVTEINYYCNTPEEKQMNIHNAISVRCVEDNPLAEPQCHEPQLVPADGDYNDVLCSEEEEDDDDEYVGE